MPRQIGRIVRLPVGHGFRLDFRRVLAIFESVEVGGCVRTYVDDRVTYRVAETLEQAGYLQRKRIGRSNRDHSYHFTDKGKQAYATLKQLERDMQPVNHLEVG